MLFKKETKLKSTWRTTNVEKPGILVLSVLLRIPGYELKRFLTREDDYWRTWTIPKFDNPEIGNVGEERIIASPREPLRNALKKKILPRLERLPVSEICFGFRKGRSIITNIEPHLSARAVFSFDLKDAFPTVTKEIVKDTLMREMKLTEKLAIPLAKLVTYKGELPQGSSCSPHIFNLVCKPMDGTICRYLSKSNGYHFKVTRYADNFTVSTPRKFIPKIVKENLLEIVARHGFNGHKIRYAEGKAVPRITGLIIVNGKIRIKRDLIERFRAMIHNRTLTPSQVRGIVSYVRMVMGYLPKRIANPYFAYLKWWYSEVYYPEKYTKKYTIQDFFVKRY